MTSRNDSGDPVHPMAMFRWGLYVSLGVLAILAAAAAVYTTRAVLVRVLIALFIAVSLDPAVRMLTRRGMRRGLAVLVIFLVAAGLVTAFLVSVIPAMIHQFQLLVHDFPGYFASLQERSARLHVVSDRFHLPSKIQGLLTSLPGRLGSGLLGYTRRLFGALASALTVAVLTIYFMTDLPRLRRGVRQLFPKAHRARFGRIADVMVDKVGDYMIGNLLISLAAGLASFAVFTILGMPFAVPLAFVVAVCDLSPMIGATLGAVVCVLAALLTTELWPTTVIVAIFFVAYQQLENYVIAPRILRHTVSMSAAAVLLAALIGGTVLGLVGALMAIPIAAALKVVLTEQLHARDAAEADSEESGDHEAVAPPGPAGGAAPAPAPPDGATPAPGPHDGATPAPAASERAVPAPAPADGPASAPADGPAPAPTPATTDRG